MRIMDRYPAAVEDQYSVISLQNIVIMVISLIEYFITICIEIEESTLKKWLFKVIFIRINKQFLQKNEPETKKPKK